MAIKKQNTFGFENALQELETIVNTMEQGNLTLEQSLEQFEKGVNLTKQCQKALNVAEQKIKILTENNKLEDYANNQK